MLTFQVTEPLKAPPLTVPVSLVPTAARPDIVIIQGKDVKLLELTVPITTTDGFQAARERKLL